MRNGRYLVRFVDVVLILLFGFISISQVQKRSVVSPPKSSETSKTPADEVTDVFVSITDTGSYLVDNETRALETMDALSLFVEQKKQQYGADRMKIRIRSDDTAPIQYAIALAEICDHAGVEKALDVRLSSRDKK
ncbi:MAG: biopolymer transporter ExbD [Rhodothermaceae bacterium]|nr:biopolymer transporter ExbD [Rhodothermaceae bacterium]